MLPINWTPEKAARSTLVRFNMLYLTMLEGLDAYRVFVKLRYFKLLVKENPIFG